jgi:hypothetical protein
MISEAISNETGEITIRVPVTLVTRLNEVVPARQHNQFVQRAIEELLALEEQTQALAESAGAWAGDGYADLDSPEAVAQWRRTLRHS